MQPILEGLAEQHAELDSILVDLDEAGWARPSRCNGWTVADVVLHLSQTDEMARASIDGRFDPHLETIAAAWSRAIDVDEGAAAMVAGERGRPGAEVHDRWRRAASELRQVLAGCEPSRRLPWVAGELSARTLATTRLAEAWIHTGDVATALGMAPTTTGRLRHIARLAWRTLPYAFAKDGVELHGPVAFELDGPAGDRWEFAPDEPATTTVRGPALDLCLVAGRRADPDETALEAVGPDGGAVLRLVRTFA